MDPTPTPIPAPTRQAAFPAGEGDSARAGTVRRMAEAEIQSGLTAGTSYPEVWIRDLNTFITPACSLGDPAPLRRALLTFLEFQQEDGQIIDGYVPVGGSHDPYKFYTCPARPDLLGHKNNVESDQESSLVQAVARYVRVTGDTALLAEPVGGEPFLRRLERAMGWLLDARMSTEHGLVWSATTIDWGDLQPEHEWGVRFDENSHRAIGIYTNAMAAIALDDLAELLELAGDPAAARAWRARRETLAAATRRHLWDEAADKFRPHTYLAEGSPFPADFDEDAIYYHGGTAVAAQAGLMSQDEVRRAFHRMRDNARAAGARTIGITVWPTYPAGMFKNPALVPFGYQNGGDWPWFGGRMVLALAQHGLAEEAREALRPMLDLVLEHGGFWEWYTPAGEPRGAAHFRGAAGVLWEAISSVGWHVA